MEATEVRILIIASILLLGFFGVFIIAMFLVFKKKQLEHQQKLRAIEQASVTAQMEIQEKIMADTSRDLHDNVGQLLALVNLNMRTLSPPEREEDKQKLEQSKKIMTDVIESVRNISKNMNGDKILEAGLINAFKTELRIIEISGNYETEFTSNTNEVDVADNIAIIIFRIVQETLHNIIKHAEANLIKMNVDKTPDMLTIYISDNGKGFNYTGLKPEERGQGIKNIEKRALLINAVFVIKSKLNEGTTITLSLNGKN